MTDHICLCSTTVQTVSGGPRIHIQTISKEGTSAVGPQPQRLNHVIDAWLCNARLAFVWPPFALICARSPRLPALICVCIKYMVSTYTMNILTFLS